MRVKQFKGKVYGADLTAKERKAMELEINRQIAEADRQHANDFDAMVLYVLHTHLGFGKKRLRRFYDAFSAEHDKLIAAPRGDPLSRSGAGRRKRAAGIRPCHSAL